MATEYTFKMGMTCDGCAGAARKVLGKIGLGENDVKIDVEKQTVVVTSDKASDVLLEQLKKTGKTIELLESKSQ